MLVNSFTLIALLCLDYQLVSASEFSEVRESAELSCALRDASSVDVSLPVDKPIPSSESFKPTELSIHSLKSIHAISSIPEYFVINDRVSSFSSFLIDGSASTSTSSEVMTQRAELYLLLSEIYKYFDSFDLAGFNAFLIDNPDITDHQCLRYHLVENILERATASSNSDSLDLMGKFIGIIDQNSQAVTAGATELSIFEEFKGRFNVKSLHLCIGVPFSEYLKRESRRLRAIESAFKSQDYCLARQMIEASNSKLYVSMSDFIVLLNCGISESRYEFFSWALSVGVFNVHERVGLHQLTPLMLAAMKSKCSTDIVRVIISHFPDTINDVDVSGKSALDHAFGNKSLGKNHRHKLIKILQLEDAVLTSLDESGTNILNEK